MRFIILCGGLGTRLGVTTIAVNKHLLPIGDSPMVSHAVSLAYSAGFNSTLIVTDAASVSQFARLTETESKPYHSIRTYFAIQSKPLGIADAIRRAREYCDSGPVVVMLGDNRFDAKSRSQILNTMVRLVGDFGCHIWCVRHQNPERYGVLELNQNNEIKGIYEKPKTAVGNMVITGLYAFDSRVWEIIDGLVPSLRGELEVTDIIKCYLPNVNYEVLEGEWSDLGHSIQSYLIHAAEECSVERS
jgi:glucose-1-phosphate thymidylyltransferase